MTFTEFKQKHVGSDITDIINGWRDNDDNAYTHWNVDNYQTNYTCNECGKEGYTDICEDCESTDITGEMQSPEKYYIVSPELADELSKAGEVVIREFKSLIWGVCDEEVLQKIFTQYGN